MNSTIITTLLQLIINLLPQIGVNSKVVNTILNSLIQLVPLAVQEAKDILPAIQNIIAALSANPATTAQQLATLRILDAQVDAAFEEAVSKWSANYGASA